LATGHSSAALTTLSETDKQVKTGKKIDKAKKQEHYALTTPTKLSWWSKIISIFK
jgi:hypothetical protein